MLQIIIVDFNGIYILYHVPIFFIGFNLKHFCTGKAYFRLRLKLFLLIMVNLQVCF
jgi:hypothetical protein